MQFFFGVNDNVTAGVLFSCDGCACLSFPYIIDRKYVVLNQAIDAYLRTRNKNG